MEIPGRFARAGVIDRSAFNSFDKDTPGGLLASDVADPIKSSSDWLFAGALRHPIHCKKEYITMTVFIRREITRALLGEY